MADLSFRQQAAQRAATQLRAKVQAGDLRNPLMATIGNISIALRSCIGQPRYVGPDGVEHPSGGHQFVVVLAMSNLSGAAPVRYRGWASGEGESAAAAADDVTAGASDAVLSDDLGTHYRRSATSRGLERWVGQVSGTRSVGPGETLADVLVFAAPNPRATKFTLELPRANWGATGVLRIELPAARVANFSAASST